MNNPHWLRTLPSACMSINDAVATLGEAMLDHNRVGTQDALRKMVLTTAAVRSQAGLPSATAEPRDHGNHGPGAVVAEAVSALRAIADESSELAVLALTLRLEQLRPAQEPTDPAQVLTDTLESIESLARGLARTLDMDLD